MRMLLFLFLALAVSCATKVASESTKARQWDEGNYIINLYDAFGTADDELQQDFGFSAVIRYNGKTILFDAGTNADILKANCEALGIDLRDVDYAVASHAHFDHINGFDYLLQVNPKVKIYFPADMFWGKNVPFDLRGPEPEVAQSLPKEQRYFGGVRDRIVFNQSGRFWKANVDYIGDHVEIEPGVTLIATSSPYIGYFTRYPSLGGVKGLKRGAGDVKTLELPELSLNLATPHGDVLVVGCSHSLVETIVRETKAHLERDVGLVMGGYHLLPYGTAQVRGIATRMRDELGVRQVAPAHCTGHLGFKVFQEVFGQGYHVAGLGSRTPFPSQASPD